jgi:hypothetical protein
MTFVHYTIPCFAALFLIRTLLHLCFQWVSLNADGSDRGFTRFSASLLPNFRGSDPVFWVNRSVLGPRCPIIVGLAIKSFGMRWLALVRCRLRNGTAKLLGHRRPVSHSGTAIPSLASTKSLLIQHFRTIAPVWSSGTA